VGHLAAHLAADLATLRRETLRVVGSQRILVDILARDAIIDF